MLTVEYANSFGLAAFGQITQQKFESDLDALGLEPMTTEQRIERVTQYLMTLPEADRPIALGYLRGLVGDDPSDVAAMEEIAKRLKEAERGVLAKYWWLWTLLGVVGVTGFGLIVYRGVRKSKRRRRH